MADHAIRPGLSSAAPWTAALFLAFAALALLPAPGSGQIPSIGDVPIEINADGETKYTGGIASANDNVRIQYGDVAIYCDRAQFDPQSYEAVLEGRVRIYQEGKLILADHAVYNFKSGRVSAAGVRGSSTPFFYNAETVDSLGKDAFIARTAAFTTHDSSKPDYRLKARTVRIYPGDRVVFSNVSWYVGNVPIFWLPYVYQSLDEDTAVNFSPGYSSDWGAYLLTKYAFPLTENISGVARLDLRADRGVAGGIDLNTQFGENNRSWGQFKSYVLSDQDPDLNNTGLARTPIDSDRYRIGYQGKTYFTDDIYLTADVTKLSDEYVMEDFYPGEFRIDPQPDAVVALTKLDANFAITAMARAQVNDFFETTERLPEVALDVTRQPIGTTGLFYEGESSFAALSREFADDSDLPSYDTNRFDTFHQILYPKTFGGWLSVVPRAGVRLTYYDESGFIEEIAEDPELTAEMLAAGTDASTLDPVVVNKLQTGGSETRTIFNLGFEASMKASNTWDNVQSRGWGLDGLRHIVQPYTNFSYVSDPGADPEEILQFDRLVPSTRLVPIDFPQFTAIDAIDTWTVWRLGVRNRLLTRRGDATHSWLELDSYFDVNIDNPYDDTDFSNVFNNLSFRPLPWAALNIDSQLPILDDGFTEVNTSVRVMPTRDIQVSVGNRYLQNNDFFGDSNLGTLGLHYRVNDHWAFSMYEQYEFDDSTLESQSYTIHRDLTSWVASLGALVRDNRGEEEFAVLLTFTLKDLPQVSFPLSLDSGQGSGE